MDVVIYHNPNCGTSRNTLAMIRNARVEPHVIEYLKTPPSRRMVRELVDRAGLTPRQALREKGTPYAELGLDDLSLSDEALLDAIAGIEKAYVDRIIPIGPEIVDEWTRMLGVNNKDRWDLALAATARVHGLTLVTRNTTDFSGRGVRLLNPFLDPPLINEP